MSETPNQDILSQVSPPAMEEILANKNSPIEEPPDKPLSILNREEKSSEKDFRLINEEVEDRKADRALREKFGDKAYKVVRKTLYGWCWFLTIYAVFKFRFNVELFSDNVIIAITSAVTLNVFAAFLGVIRGLFPSQKSSKD